MSNNAGKMSAILLGKSLTQPIDFQSLAYDGLPQHEQDCIKVFVAACRIYHHSQGDINAHYAGHLWHDFSRGDFIRLMNNLDLATSNFKKITRLSIFPPPKKMHLSLGLSFFYFSDPC